MQKKIFIHVLYVISFQQYFLNSSFRLASLSGDMYPQETISNLRLLCRIKHFFKCDIWHPPIILMFTPLTVICCESTLLIFFSFWFCDGHEISSSDFLVLLVVYKCNILLIYIKHHTVSADTKYFWKRYFLKTRFSHCMLHM